MSAGSEEAMSPLPEGMDAPAPAPTVSSLACTDACEQLKKCLLLSVSLSTKDAVRF